MLRKSRVIFPSKSQRFKDALIDVITDSEATINDFFNTVAQQSESIKIESKDRHKVLRKILRDKDLWEMVSKKIDDHLEFVLRVETDSIVLLDSPNVPPKAKNLIKPFIIDYLDTANNVTKAIESLRNLHEVMVNDEQ
jgi:hypothetical protein